eukprot:3602722-Prymnesium_polylepis.1
MPDDVRLSDRVFCVCDVVSWPPPNTRHEMHPGRWEFTVVRELCQLTRVARLARPRPQPPPTDSAQRYPGYVTRGEAR